jgi:hypothetical protein
MPCARPQSSVDMNIDNYRISASSRSARSA